MFFVTTGYRWLYEETKRQAVEAQLTLLRRIAELEAENERLRHD